MAGRGTDIVLGGNVEIEIEQLGSGADQVQIDAVRADQKQRHKQVLEAGGLRVIGTERHESRRIDNQLRGRSGRQGDPGSSRFYLSLEDNLMRIFASDRVAGLMQKLGMQEGEAIEHPWVNKAIENAQRKVEGRNFDIRKNLLDYDDVANDQRKVVYRQRDDLMNVEDVSDEIQEIRDEVVNDMIDMYIPPQSLEEQWDIEGLSEALKEQYDIQSPIQQWLDDDDDLHEETLRQRILDQIIDVYKAKEAQAGPEQMRRIEKEVMLYVLDSQWKEHLAAMDYLRNSIHLRGYAQKNPKQEYKREAFEMFTAMLGSMKQEVVQILTRLQLQEMPQPEPQPDPAEFNFQHEEFTGLGEPESVEAAPDQGDAEQQPYVRPAEKVGRNEPCPCGSGKKFKQCHGKLN
jgi:preprotein translocase subunit SecA